MLNVIKNLPKDDAVDRVDDCLIALRRILRSTDQHGRELAKSAGLTPVQFRALQIVGEKSDCTATAIATQMSVSQATVTHLVDKLVQLDLVERRKSATDRRQTNIALTATGRATLEDAPDALQQQFVARFEAMEDWEKSMLVSALERVAAMLDADDLDASPVLYVGEIRKS